MMSRCMVCLVLHICHTTGKRIADPPSRLLSAHNSTLTSFDYLLRIYIGTETVQSGYNLSCGGPQLVSSPTLYAHQFPRTAPQLMLQCQSVTITGVTIDSLTIGTAAGLETTRFGAMGKKSTSSIICTGGTPRASNHTDCIISHCAMTHGPH